MSKPKESFYLHYNQEAKQALQQAGIRPDGHVDCYEKVVYVGNSGFYWGSSVDPGVIVHTLPQDQQTVYNLLNLPLPMQQDTQPDTIYLSGTPGQLEGFRQDWVKAGYPASDSAISWQDSTGKNHHHYLLVEFVRTKPNLITAFNTAKGAVPVLENWQALLDRAAKHVKNQTVAPVKIAGREVEFKEGLVQIGCRKQLKPGNITELVYQLRMLNEQGAKIVGLQLSDSHDLVEVESLKQLATWLEEKN